MSRPFLFLRVDSRLIPLFTGSLPALHSSRAAVAHGHLFAVHDDRDIPAALGMPKHLLQLCAVQLDIHVLRFFSVGFTSLRGVGSPCLAIYDYFICHGAPPALIMLPLLRVHDAGIEAVHLI